VVLQRLWDIFCANWNEEPPAEGLAGELQDALLEMEQAVARTRADAARLLADARLAASRQEEHQREAASCQQQAEQAVLAGDDDSARSALARKQEAERLAFAFREQAVAATAAATALEEELTAQKQRLAEARLQAGVLQARHQAAEIRRRDVQPAFDTPAFQRYNRICQRMDQEEAPADAVRDLDTLPAGGLAGPATDLDTELGELKRRRGKA
jgi:phage shock protein A